MNSTNLYTKTKLFYSQMRYMYISAQKIQVSGPFYFFFLNIFIRDDDDDIYDDGYAPVLWL